jgi:protein arginine kinase activator
MSGMKVCTQCGFTYGEFLSRGLLGCPQCYACFGEVLWADLLQMHPGLHQHPMPVLSEMGPESGSRTRNEDLEDLARLKETFADALRGERYEEAAGLRQRIKAWEESHGPR